MYGFARWRKRKSKAKVELDEKKYVVCVENQDVEASLERWKIYRAIADEEALSHNMIRVVDESGEDYLFPTAYFAPIDLPKKVEQAMKRTANS